MSDTNKVPVECPLVPWYKFHVCDIKTCKSNTNETEHRCLELDRRRPGGTKQYSDAELNLYKFRDRSISTRQVQIYRKNAVQAVKSILILHKFVEWLSTNYERGASFDSDEIRQAEKKTPLSIKRLGWENWMWEHVLDKSAWERFAGKTDGECKEFELHQLLGITLDEYTVLQKLQSTYRMTK